MCEEFSYEECIDKLRLNLEEVLEIAELTLGKLQSPLRSDLRDRINTCEIGCDCSYDTPDQRRQRIEDVEWTIEVGLHGVLQCCQSQVHTLMEDDLHRKNTQDAGEEFLSRLQETEDIAREYRERLKVLISKCKLSLRCHDKS